MGRGRTGGASRAAGYRGALGHRDFRVLMARYAVSGVGSWAYIVALIAFVYDQTGSATWIGIVSVARLAPMFVFSTVAGVLAERYERTRLMLVSDVSALVCMIALVAVSLADAPAWVAVVLAAITSAVTILEEPAVAALVPQVVHEDHLAAANGLFGVIANLNVMVGPTVGAAFLAVTTVTGTFTLNAATFAVAAGLVLMLRTRSTPTAGAGGGDDGFVRQLTVGVRVLAEHPAVVTLVAAGTLASFLYGLDTVLFPLIGEDLGLGSNGFGYLLTGLGVGGVIGGFLAARAAKATRLALLIAICCLIFSLPTAALVLVDQSGVAFAIQVVRGAAIMVVEVLAVTALQRALPLELVSRVYGATVSLSIAAMVVGAAVAPVIVAAIDLDTTLLVVGLAVPVLVVLGAPWWTAVDRVTAERMAALAPRVSRLESLGIFADASQSALERLAASAEEVEVAAGTVVVREGEPADALYVVVDGQLEASAAAGAGQPVLLATMSAPAYFGEIGLLDRVPRTATVTATTPAVLYRIDGPTFLDVLSNTDPSPAFVESSRLRRARSGGPGSGDRAPTPA